MLKRCAVLTSVFAVFLAVGYGKNPIVSGQGGILPAAAEVKVIPPGVATSLGFATLVPKDADLYFSGFHADDQLMALVKGLGKNATPGESDEKLHEALAYVGDEMFLFVGPGAGSQLQMIGESYRELSSAWAGMAAQGMLGALASKKSEPDFSKLTEILSDGSS